MFQNRPAFSTYVKLLILSDGRKNYAYVAIRSSSAGQCQITVPYAIPNPYTMLLQWCEQNNFSHKNQLTWYYTVGPHRSTSIMMLRASQRASPCASATGAERKKSGGSSKRWTSEHNEAAFTGMSLLRLGASKP